MEWLSIDEFLPKKGDKILCHTKRDGIKIGSYIDYKKPTIYDGNKDYQFRFWYPISRLPKPPQ